MSRSTPRFEVRNVAHRTAYLYKITNKLDAAWLNMHTWTEGPKFYIRRGQEIFPSATPYLCHLGLSSTLWLILSIEPTWCTIFLSMFTYFLKENK